MFSDQELIEGLRDGLAPLRPPENLIDRLREDAAGGPSGTTRRAVGRKPALTSTRRWLSAEGLVLAAACVAVAVVVVGAIALLGHRRTATVQTGPAVRKPAGGDRRALTPTRRPQPILNAAGIANTTFGASSSDVEQLLKPLLGRPTRAQPLTGDCGVNRTLTWPLLISTSTGRPVQSERLTIFLDHDRFVGYQYGDGTLAPRGSGRLRLRATTTRGLALGDPVRAARRQYGPAFRTSAAQGGTWSAQTPSGTLRGYLTGDSRRAVVTPHSLIASIDAGDTGCPAVSP